MENALTVFASAESKVASLQALREMRARLEKCNMHVVKPSLQQAVKAYSIARCYGSHIV
jgi:hypothetical protein